MPAPEPSVGRSVGSAGVRGTRGPSGASQAPVRQALSDSVYEDIKARVMDHEIAPGARVGIEALARTLDVSPTPVREALARLEADGLVVKRSLSGYRATELLTRQGVEELFEMRLLLETRAAALAALHADEGQLDAMEATLEAMQAHPGPGGPYASYRDFAALDQRFHDVVAAAAHRPLLADAVERLHAHLHIFRLNSVQDAGEPTLDEHERVVRAILRRRAERAAEAMAEHLTRSLERQLSRFSP
ncbi:putative transcriptional regulator [Streptomyces ambofaciens ATCC 23877]|uniref:Putative transcriptional regulator n=1 Tax=Streptomyces ambofaciens (strain ATCC 23877 / 3486 / DSM 40053 / JCM 4204 / NBRC 12836 / NRRL B-2516) TaxID=278992 RepID=A0ACG7_STRA7|nr:GntR family transcriptional regulator [Streptomyces ambofaciens]AKZ60175.1 putative transcriptional regulator [Streptomyces ambofaciens ATCC 23877]CAJ88171.1 putative transcriptional regulator [Streptomyces ambofaciens ATCC 23877]